MERHVATLQKFTGISFDHADKQTPKINIIVWMARPDGMNKAARVFDPGDRVLKGRANGRCFTLVKPTRAGKLSAAMVMINKSLPETDIDHCILAGLVRSLGVRHQNATVTPSIFNAQEKHRKLTFIDTVIIRTLYDSRFPLTSRHATKESTSFDPGRDGRFGGSRTQVVRSEASAASPYITEPCPVSSTGRLLLVFLWQHTK